MKRNALALFAVCTIALGSTAFAKKPPAPLPNLAAAIDLQVDLSGEALPPSIPIFDQTIKLKVSHSFVITQQQEAALQSDTTITLLGIEFNPGDDPKFQNGDKSVSIQTSIDIGLGPVEELPINIKAKWGNEKFSVSVTGNLKVKDIALPPSPPATVQKLFGAVTKRAGEISPKVDNAFEIESTIRHSSIADVNVSGWLACDVEESMMQGATAEGTQFAAESQSVKSKFFTTPPPPMP